MKKAAISKSLRREAKKMGKPILVFEGGEALRLDGFSIDKALAGLENLLYAQNMLDQPSTIKHEIFHIPRSGWVRASVAGIFEWSKASGQFVVKNEPIGTIRDPYGLHEAVIHASKSGVIVGHNNSPVVNQGDALFNIGYDIEKLDV
jgi:predicted deacylase